MSEERNQNMTENEIIQYLKDNKKNGVAYHFMPEEVKTWCDSHIKDLLYFDYDNDSFEAYYEASIICENEVVALSDDYTKPVPIINLKLNIDELKIIKYVLEEGLDWDLFENDKKSIFAMLDKINALILIREL
jgi:hypothetical protein